MTYKPDVFLYHAPCDDGFGAAWAAWRKWGDEVEYIPGTYGKAPPDVTGKHVLMGDFSFKRPALEDMANKAKSIIILDHHKTAEEDLAPFKVEFCGDALLAAADIPGMLRDMAELNRPPILAHFDMTKSGARLTWEFCHPEKLVPHLIRFIEDRDLWRFALPHTRDVSLLLRSYPYDLQTWSVLDEAMERNIDGVLQEAAGISRFYNQKIDEMLKQCRQIKLDEFEIPAVNCSWAFASDVAHELLLLNPNAPFTATYYDRGDGRRSFSLRSDDDRRDVSEIARRFGGGGHRNAAGFETTIPWEQK
ncbi:MAG: phosphohydrolase [Proteobacteria bacterium]|nr:MAG: phosphohydrolase [Pseudomonadota bacterium]